MNIFLVSALALMALSFSSPAMAAEYGYDHERSKVTFTLRHLNLITVQGEFKDFSGSFEFDAETIEDSSVTLVIQTRSLDSANLLRDVQLRGKDYFWVEKHPEITFASTAFGTLRENRFDIYGDLTIRGKTVPVVFETEILTPIKEITPGKPVRFKTETYIHRKDFDLGTGRWYDPVAYMTGETLKINLEVEGYQLPALLTSEPEEVRNTSASSPSL